MKKNIAIVVDSACNLTAEQLKKHNIYSIPLTITFNNNKQIHDEESEVEANQFYKRLEMGEYIKTSQSILGDIISTWDDLLNEGYKEIIFIPIAKSLSSQYENTYKLSQEEKYLNKVHVFNIDSAATLTSVIALKAQKMALEGATVKAIEQMAQEYKKNSRIFIIPEDIQRLAKGGRAKSVIIKFIKLIKLHVIIEQTTISEQYGVGRTLTTAIDKCIKEIKILLAKASEYTFEILTSKCSTKVENIVNKIIENNANKFKINKTKLPNVFSSHAGINSVAVIAVKTK